MPEAQKVITVHISTKQSVSQYEPVEVGAAITWPMPDDATESDLAGQHTLLYEMLKAAVAEQVADMVATLREARAVPAPAQPSKPALVPPPADNELDAHFGPREDAPAQPEPAGQGGSLELKSAPKAGDRQPGQWWVDEATHYEYSDYTTRGGDDTERIVLYKEGLEFPIATLYGGSPAWPDTAWTSAMTKDGKRHEFAKPVYVVQKVGDKKNNKGFYYVDAVQLTTMQKKAVA